MRFAPFRNPTLQIDVTYDCRGGRQSKRFACPFKARQFYTTKFKAGKRPQIKARRTEDV